MPGPGIHVAFSGRLTFRFGHIILYDSCEEQNDAGKRRSENTGLWKLHETLPGPLPLSTLKKFQQLERAGKRTRLNAALWGDSCSGEQLKTRNHDNALIVLGALV